MSSNPQELPGALKIMGRATEELKKAYTRLFEQNAAMQEMGEEHGIVIYGNCTLDNGKATIQTIDNRFYEVKLSVRTQVVGPDTRIDGSLYFVGKDLLGDKGIYGKLLLRGRGLDVYCEETDKSLGSIKEPTTLNCICAWLFNNSIERT